MSALTFINNPVADEGSAKARRAFTLVEVLVATALTLIIMAVTVTLFGNVTANISNSRGAIEMHDRLTSTHERLVRDLYGVTAPTLPPLRPEWGQGYFEYVEGPVATVTGLPILDDGNAGGDTTITDNNDILMFTTRSAGEPFIGKYGIGSRQSQVAEVAWFVRGATLYRRALLVMPSIAADASWSSHRIRSAGSLTGPFYAACDISVRQVGGSRYSNGTSMPATNPGLDPIANDVSPFLAPNTLGDLTKRENRYGHQPKNAYDTTLRGGFPHTTNFWGQLGLPTLRESSSTNWPFPLVPTIAAYFSFPITPIGVTFPVNQITPAQNGGAPIRIDLWTDPLRTTAVNSLYADVDPVTGCLVGYADSGRIAEDVILTNVIGFDVKAWDPNVILFEVAGNVLKPGDNGYIVQLNLYLNWLSSGAMGPNPTTIVGTGAYANLNWNGSTISQGVFSGPGDTRSGVSSLYDTWSTHYESDGMDQDQDGSIDEGTDGIDNAYVSGDTIHPASGATVVTGGVDDVTEMEAPPPYSAPLRGIQVKIRVFEPDSRSIREVTVVQDFLPE